MRSILWLALVAAPALAACVAPVVDPASSDATLGSDAPVELPDMTFYDVAFAPGVGYHTLEELDARLDGLAATHAGIARIVEVGRSREDRPLRALVIENPDVPDPKPAPFYDGGHHGNEIEGIESTLFLAEYLLHNYERNATLRAIVDAHETWILPLVNPDGYAGQTRENAFGVNLNRNYDLDWGNPAGTSTTGPAADLLRDSPVGPQEHAGDAPFSEPESQAVRDALAALDGRLTFYTSMHTRAPGLLYGWGAPQPPFPMPPEHFERLEELGAWTRSETIFRAGTGTYGDFSVFTGYDTSGTSQDWAYAAHGVPSFTLEVAGCAGTAFTDPRWGPDNALECEEAGGALAFWVQATLELLVKMLVNADAMQAWKAADAAPLLPEGVPPEGPYS